MRTLTILFFLAATVFVACQKEQSYRHPSRQPANPVLIHDDFGITEWNLTKRAPLTAEQRQFPKKPHPEHPRGPKGGTDSTGGGGGDTSDGGGGGTPPPPPPPPPAYNAVIFLDFDGHTVTGTSWNVQPTIICKPANLTGAEQLAIRDSVAYDYRNFPVTVTADSAVFLAANPYKRQRVIITESYEWYGTAGGVSYLGSFTWGNDTPNFVFSSLLGYSVKNIFEATSHEAGHSLGLYHQSEYDASGAKTAEYRNGVIMGVGYYVANADWIIGKNSYGQIQNDTLIIGQTIRQ